MKQCDNLQVQHDRTELLPPTSSSSTHQENPGLYRESIATEHTICSPMVGVFYFSSSPGIKPFVTEGARVNIGDTVCIIEAMKIMNRIEADRAGVIKARLVDNGHPVEFGEPLFIVAEA